MAILLAAFLAAQTVCMTRADLVKQLAESWNEQPVVMALKGEELFEVFAAPDGATWTAVLSYPGGTSCVVGSGKGFELVPLRPPGDPA